MADDDQQHATAETQQIWDEAKYEASLAHLEKLREQVDALRTAIPSLVAPLMQANRTKPQLFADVKHAAVTATSELNDFRDDWKSEQTQNLLAKAHESKQKDGDLSKAASVPRYGWRGE